MTSEAQKKAGYLIPDPITGYDLLCVQMLIPNDLLYIGAFTGQMEGLAQWWNWQKTYTPGDTRATQAAQYWRYLIDTYLCIRFNEPIGDDGLACCCGSNILSRFTADGTYETSTDGGVTWTPNPGADPRNQAIANPPLPGSGGSTKCAAADNVRDQFKAMRDNLIALLTAGTTVLAIIAGIAGLLGAIMGVSGVATFFGVLLIGLATQLLALTPESVAEQLTDAVMDDFRCLVYCRVEDNGQLTYDGWHGLLSDIDAHYTDFPHTFFFSIVNSMGYVGMSNAGTIGVSTAEDCTGCDCGTWCYTFDFTESDGGWTPRTDGFTSAAATYSAGVGWIGTQTVGSVFGNGFSLCSIFKDIGSTANLTSIVTDAVVVPGTGYGVDSPGQYIMNAAAYGSYDSGTHKISWTGDINTNQVLIDSNAGFTADGSPPGGSVTITRVTLHGTGVNPFGLDNCD